MLAEAAADCGATAELVALVGAELAEEAEATVEVAALAALTAALVTLTFEAATVAETTSLLLLVLAL